jgi:hypothetical protein
VSLAFDERWYPILIDKEEIYGPQVLSSRRIHDWHFAFDKQPSKILPRTDFTSGQKIQIVFEDLLKLLAFIRTGNPWERPRGNPFHLVDLTQDRLLLS